MFRYAKPQSFYFSLTFFTFPQIKLNSLQLPSFSNADASKCPVLAKTHAHHQKYEGRIGHGTVFESKAKISSDWARRFLVGPGSSPPLCTSKCGNCTPCRPVHVTVPPGTPVTAEYYPEAWRCKCGNKLNMP
ncbi:EPIDERMAL PATTERNING FACTOR-like protein [Vigna angularis]|uniref:Epidermal patterning factor-like protein n=1 Tax=Phaseolus angularis TaxID=3914 RepID=A0A8T0K890_PHAAN|nr:EPIDERMAL PATTERNING FACTOR-like protein [Vigna angularis]